ncbi:hypothetical protein JCM9279_006987 [Rhodotorula babjevae]
MAESQQPHNPLLPSPISRLPRELLDQVFGHLELSMDSEDRPKIFKAEIKLRKLGTNVSLVCKAWHLAGRRVAWSQVTCLWDDGRLVEFLLKDENDKIVKEIRKLVLIQPVQGMQSSTSDLHRRAAVDFVRLVERCSTRLNVLKCRFPEEAPALWARLATATSAASLRTLELATPISSDDAFLSLSRALAKFSQLKALTVYPSLCPGWQELRSSSPSEPAPVVPALSVTDLVLYPRGDRTVQPTLAMGPHLASLLDSDQLRSLYLRTSARDAAALTWIGQFRNLEHIFLNISMTITPRGPTISYFVEVVSSLPVVRRVFVGSDPGEDAKRGMRLEPSPISLGRLLAKLPPRVEYYNIGGGVYFVEDLGLSMVAEDRLPTPEFHLNLNLKLEQDKEARPRTIFRRTQADGRQSWSRLVAARPVWSP